MSLIRNKNAFVPGKGIIALVCGRLYSALRSL